VANFAADIVGITDGCMSVLGYQGSRRLTRDSWPAPIEDFK